MKPRDTLIWLALIAVLIPVGVLTLLAERQNRRLDAVHANLSMLREDMEDLQVRVNAMEDRDGGRP